MPNKRNEPQPEIGQGIFTQPKGKSAVLVDPSRVGGSGDGRISVAKDLVRQYGIAEGASVVGPLRRGKRGPELQDVDSVCGLSPSAFADRPAFRQLVAIDPNDRFPLADCGETSMRMVDLVAPLGKGQRALIVSPPQAGKTMMLEQIAQAIRESDAGARIIVLLIDERPEEVTYFRRGVNAEVFASSSDQRLGQHAFLAELMLAHIRTELECGHNVVVLLDSLTRLSRTYNLRGRGRGRTLSGGMDAAALELPRRFFGLARNIEDGGSVTIVATVLVDTGSRMDQVIYEEFKGTGNSEIVLDRDLAEARMFPAINLIASGTRKTEHLYGADEFERLTRLRRALAQHKPREALTLLQKLLVKYPTNEELLQSIAIRL